MTFLCVFCWWMAWLSSLLAILLEWLCHSVWLFHLHSTVKRQPFSPVFPLAESIAEAFFWLFLWNFKEKSINHFLGHSLDFYQRCPQLRQCRPDSGSASASQPPAGGSRGASSSRGALPSPLPRLPAACSFSRLTALWIFMDTLLFQ